MKKVLFTSHVANFAKFNYPFMEWFKSRGYEVHYASMGEEEINCDNHFIVPFERSPFKLNNLRAVSKLKKIIDAEGYDVIHTHTPMGGVVTRIAAMTARKKGTKVIYTAHGFHFFKGGPLLSWLIYYPMERVMAYVTDVLVTVNQEDYLRARRFSTNEVYKINGVGVDLDKFKPVSVSKRRAIRIKYGFDDGDFVLLCVAEFTKNKNQKFLINSFIPLIARYPNIKIIFAGRGDELEACKTLSGELGISANLVRFMGYRKDVDQLCLLSDVLVSASYREGLAVNIIEGMASGLPVVCTDIRGCYDLIENNVNGYLYDINNTDAYVEAVGKLIESKSTYDKIRQNNVHDAEIYSKTKAIANMEYVYEKTN